MAITRPCQGRNVGSIPIISSNARSFVIIEPLKSIDSKDLAIVSDSFPMTFRQLSDGFPMSFRHNSDNFRWKVVHKIT